MRLKQHIPNALTICNLACGLASLSFSGFYDFREAAYCIFAAALFDFADGGVARLLRAQSALGRELDSLADVVSFGAAPGLLLFFLTYDKAYMFRSFGDFAYELYIVVGSAMLIPICTAIRLARFNIDVRKRRNFRGLPSPANGVFIATIPFVLNYQIYGEPAESHVFNTYTVLTLNVLLSVLLVSPLPMLSLKPKNGRWHNIRFHLLLAFLAVPLALIFGFAASPVIFVLYLLISQIDALLYPDRLERIQVISKDPPPAPREG